MLPARVYKAYIAGAVRLHDARLMAAGVSWGRIEKRSRLAALRFLRKKHGYEYVTVNYLFKR